MAKRKGSAGNSARRKKSTNKYSRRSGSNKLGNFVYHSSDDCQYSLNGGIVFVRNDSG